MGTGWSWLRIRDRWRALVGEEPSGSENAGNFFTRCRTS